MQKTKTTLLAYFIATCWLGLVLIPLPSCLAQNASNTIYVCPPCHNTCDNQKFHQPGNCPTCGMTLIPREERLHTEEFSFTFENIRYSAEVAKPKHTTPVATVVIIPGHGQTDFVGGGHYYALRQFFNRLGMATLVWDKKGCGKSEGTYEHHQTVESSSLEAIAAIEAFREHDSLGSKPIGLWGISRGGWICPLVINKYPSIAFWISVSGTDQFDTFRYMLETNLKIEGRSDQQAREIMKQWDHYVTVLRHGGESYEQFVRSTEKLFTDPLLVSLGQKRVTEAEFHASQEYYGKADHLFDKQTGLMILVPDFDNILQKINCPVLAVFGELDSQVDWRKTKTLYQRTIGSKTEAKLEIRTLPNCNHNMMMSDTGGFFEDISHYNNQACFGYYDTMRAWLAAQGFVR